MDFLKTLLAYMTATFVIAVESTATPAVTPVPTPAPTPVAPVVITSELPPEEEAVPTVSVTPRPVATITPNRAYHNLAQGARGAEVKKLQERLIELGYLAEGSADGAFGGKTRKAVRLFQYFNGLTMDGIAGRATQTNLFENPEAMPYPGDTTPEPSPAPDETVPAGPETETPAPEETEPAQNAADIAEKPAEEANGAEDTADEPEDPGTAHASGEMQEPAGEDIPEEMPESADGTPVSEAMPDESAGETPSAVTAEPAEEAPSDETAAPGEETPVIGDPEDISGEETGTEDGNPAEEETDRPDEPEYSPEPDAATDEMPPEAPDEVEEDVDLDSPEYTELAANVVLNDGGAPMSWTTTEDGVPVEKKPRVRMRDGRIYISLEDLTECEKEWVLTDHGDTVVLEAEGYTLGLYNEETGVSATLDGVEIPLEGGEYGFDGEGYFMEADFLARIMNGTAEWDPEENTLMLRIRSKEVSQSEG